MFSGKNLISVKNVHIMSMMIDVFSLQPQPAFTCSKLTIEILEQGVKYVQS